MFCLNTVGSFSLGTRKSEVTQLRPFERDRLGSKNHPHPGPFVGWLTTKTPGGGDSDLTKQPFSSYEVPSWETWISFSLVGDVFYGFHTIVDDQTFHKLWHLGFLRLFSIQNCAAVLFAIFTSYRVLCERPDRPVQNDEFPGRLLLLNSRVAAPVDGRTPSLMWCQSGRWSGIFHPNVSARFCVKRVVTRGSC